ncbi:hypothetical protein SAMN02745129_4696 [Ferrimonas marina]|uniref:Lipoprotein n=2 Tax=Ferrimonas marina TaxID=299255 RepID=A0A1M5Z5J8_9GAMM|nr:hypothetical protein SAMN02745129_4696 [Ferrimonas marina]
MRTLLLLIACALAGCQSGHLGSFADHSYTSRETAGSTALGPASGIACQRYWLYLIPAGEAPSTQTALAEALAQHPNTDFLANVTVESRASVHFGYLDDCILVEGEARSFAKNEAKLDRESEAH